MSEGKTASVDEAERRRLGAAVNGGGIQSSKTNDHQTPRIAVIANRRRLWREIAVNALADSLNNKRQRLAFNWNAALSPQNTVRVGQRPDLCLKRARVLNLA